MNQDDKPPSASQIAGAATQVGCMLILLGVGLFACIWFFAAGGLH
jgi:hypothetical protein